MSDESKEQTGPKQDTQCPFAALSPTLLAAMAPKPWRKRHPLLFWGCIAVALLVAWKVMLADTDEEKVQGDCIAFVPITGTIGNVESTLEWISQIANQPRMKGVLLRVDSPGGGAAASQELYAALAALGKKVPIAASMGATAASGGLMVSMAAERIFANAATLTGSIGVRMDIPQIQGLMGKLGVGQETLVSGPFKDATSYLHPLTPEDRAYLQNLVMALHGQFVDIVATSRKLPREQVEALANGKIYTGQEAQQLGLVDVIGGQEAALAWLAEKTGVPAHRALYRRKVSRTRLLDRLLDSALSLGAAQLWRQLTGQGSPGIGSQELAAPGAGTPMVMY